MKAGARPVMGENNSNSSDSFGVRARGSSRRISQASVAHQQQLQQYMQKHLENQIIEWKRKHEGGEFSQYLKEVCPENIRFAADDSVEWIDDRLLGPKWKGAFVRLTASDELHELGELPVMGGAGGAESPSHMEQINEEDEEDNDEDDGEVEEDLLTSAASFFGFSLTVSEADDKDDAARDQDSDDTSTEGEEKDPSAPTEPIQRRHASPNIINKKIVDPEAEDQD